MQSKLFRLGWNDLGKGLLVAVLTAICAWLIKAMDVPGFDFVTLDWGSLFSVAITAGIGYIGKNFLTTQEGQFLGIGKKYR